MPFTISKEVRFSASHQTIMPDGVREPLHGHNYRARIHLEAPRLDDKGMVADFAIVKALALEAIAPLDHRHLNDLPEFRGAEPTAEMIARHIFDACARRLDDGRVKVVRVEVWESDNNRAEYRAS